MAAEYLEAWCYANIQREAGESDKPPVNTTPAEQAEKKEAGSPTASDTKETESVLSQSQAPKELLSVPLRMVQWADLFHVSKSDIYRMKDNETLHFVPMTGQKYSLPESELPAEYMAKFAPNTP
ncbi:MAG: hypothetical protein ACYTEQ_11450 [Planctomycetota bacterium]